MTLSFQQIEATWTQAGGPAGLAPLMAAIAEAESGGQNIVQPGQPYATTGWGLWQITPGNSEPQAGTDQQLLTPSVNAQAALAKYNSQGLGAWQGDAAYNIWQQHGAPTNPTVAQLSSWGIDTQGASGASSAVTSPVGPGLTQGRTDQGVDYSGSGPLNAIGAGTIESISNSGWPGGTFIDLLLNSPVDAAHTSVYYAEDINPAVTVGQQVAQGQQIGTATGGPDGIEIGWADPNAIGQSLNTALNGPYSGSGPTPEGTNFANYISGSGVPGSSSGVDVPATNLNAQNFTGVAGFFQEISDLLNPHYSNSTPIIGGAYAGVENLVAMVVFRGMFALGFMGLTYIGIKMLTGKSKAPSITTTIEKQQDLSQQRARTDSANQAEAGRTQRATMVNIQKDKERANPTVRRSEITHTKSTTTNPQTSGPTDPGVGKLAKDVAEAAVLAPK